MNNDKDLFEGLSVPKAIAKFAVPTVLSQLVTLLYNLADTFFVGHTNDPSQIAALTLSFPIFMMLTMIANLFGIGANSLISRSIGTGDRERAKKASGFAFYAAVASTLLLISALLIFMKPALHAIGAKSAETYDATKAYLMWTVVFGGIPTVCSMVLGHLTRAEGNTKQASIGMALGGILNILLDPVFVQGLGMGASGAGLATCISNVAALGYLGFITFRNKNTVIRISPKKFRFDKMTAQQVILVGIPAAAIIVLGSAANIVLTHYMSDYGDTSVGAFGIVQKIGTVTIQISVGLTQGIMPLLGYSYGSNNLARVKSISRWSFGILAVFAAFCLVTIELFAPFLMRLFTSDEPIITTGTGFLHIWILCAPGMCLTCLLNSIFQAMGKWLQSLLLSIIRQGVILIPLLIVLNNTVGKTGLVCSQPVADTCSLIIGLIFYVFLMKKHDSGKAVNV